MRKLLVKYELDIEPFSFGGKKGEDFNKRERIRKLIVQKYPDFSQYHIEQKLADCTDIDVVLNCYLKKPLEKDIDNLAKIPIDAIFFSAKDEPGVKNKSESKISSLVINKINSETNHLEVIIYGMQPERQ